MKTASEAKTWFTTAASKLTRCPARCPAVILAITLVLAGAARAGGLITSELPRKNAQPLEKISGLDSVYGELTTRDGTKLRTILTKPKGATGRLPAILFVQWLSCDSIELPPAAKDGWSNMLRRVAQESGLVMMRTEKRGVGDSQGGPCSELDYLTELSDHLDALRSLKQSEFVDPDRIILFGGSMGANMVPLIAVQEPVAGVMVWGGGAYTWFERMMTFERQHRELSGTDPKRLDDEMKQVTRFLFHYLVEGQTPEQIRRSDEEAGGTWQKLVGTDKDGAHHYGRPILFHQQAQKQNWAGAWARLDRPVLVLFGEYDWFEEASSHALIQRLVNRNKPGLAEFHVLPRLNHHFTEFRTPEDAAAEKGGTVREGPAVEKMLQWLKRVTGP